MFKNALVSVANKEGLVEFLKPYAEKGLRVVSTGGTAKHLKDNGIEVIEVSEQTGFPEVMDGRVKTLHPHVHMCLLAREGNSKDQEILKEFDLQAFDLVIGNLYMFEQALQSNKSEQELIEFIDIGGPSFLRAAAKSFERISVVSDPSDYEWIQQKAELTLSDRKFLAAKVYAHTSSYDAMIANQFMTSDQRLSNKDFSVGGQLVQSLRYGENPSQKATWYRELGASWGLHQAERLHGKELSYNNLLDLDGAILTLQDFSEGTCVVSVKHNNPCGVALGSSIEEAVERSLNADPVSVFGGIIAANKEINAAAATHLSKLFLECVVAPSFSTEALEILTQKKNIRLLAWPELVADKPTAKVKSSLGGFLIQSEDEVHCEWQSSWEVVGRTPSDIEKKALMMAWKACAHLKSNAIAIAGEDYTVGLGMGQVNRVDAVEQAIGRWKKHHANVSDVALASDAFFPFADSIEKAAQAGVQAIIQPGGSIKDEEVKEAVKKFDMTMVLTGQRHFLH
jgi:phosphoribosylaminoimidazolecarboxamide formyltransferase/IMP cyclohydrolase